jgi:cardiolipin synthase (CMP-forming)
MRTSAPSLAGSALFLVADVAWLGLARPEPLQLLIPWFALLVLAGAFVPGQANQVTLARAHLAAPALVYSVSPGKLLPLAGVVFVAGMSDLLDGAVARRLKQQSRLGGALDPVVDGLFFGALAIGLAVGVGYPWWVAAVVVARYGLPALVGGILVLAGRRPALEHTPLGQASTMVIAFLLGGPALLRGLGWGGSDWVVSIAEVLIPAATLATFANLLWANRRALLGQL